MLTEPHDLDAERVVLGSLISEPDSWLAVEDILDHRAFYDPDHSTVARGAIALLRSKRPADPTAVKGWLKDNGHDDADLLLLPLLLTQHATTLTTALRVHAERLKSLWVLRERRQIARDILADEGTEGVEERLAKDASRLLAVETGKVTSARQAKVVLMERMEELEAECKAGVEDRWKRQVPTGIRELDALLNGLEPGELVIFGARPGVGKSSIALAISEHTGSMGIPTGIFWLEDYAKQWATRALSRRSLVPAQLLRHGSSLRKEHWDSLGIGVASSFEWPIWIDDTHGLTARQVGQRMRRLHRDHGVRVFIADHLGEIRLDREDRWGERHDLAMGDAMRIYRDTAAELGAVPILMAQLGRENEKRGGEPKLSDLYGSGIAEQAVRVAVFLSRTSDGRLMAQVVKNTNGPKGEIELHWEPDTMSVRSKPIIRPLPPTVRRAAAPIYVPNEEEDA